MSLEMSLAENSLRDLSQRAQRGDLENRAAFLPGHAGGDPRVSPNSNSAERLASASAANGSLATRSVGPVWCRELKKGSKQRELFGNRSIVYPPTADSVPDLSHELVDEHYSCRRPLLCDSSLRHKRKVRSAEGAGEFSTGVEFLCVSASRLSQLWELSDGSICTDSFFPG